MLCRGGGRVVASLMPHARGRQASRSGWNPMRSCGSGAGPRPFPPPSTPLPGSTDQRGMRFVHGQQEAVPALELRQLAQRREIPIHGEERVGHHQFPGACAVNMRVTESR